MNIHKFILSCLMGFVCIIVCITILLALDDAAYLLIGMGFIGLIVGLIGLLIYDNFFDKRPKG